MSTQSTGAVFLSYASQDATVAQQVCAALEASGQPCWIAPRDVRAGTPYASAIVEAINFCRMLVLLLSKNATDSPHVLREVERACSKRRPVLTVRLDDAAIPTELEYFLSVNQWLDASGGRIEAIFPALIAAARGQTVEPQPPATQAATRSGSASRPMPSSNRLFIALGAVVAVGAGYLLFQHFWLNNSAQATPRPVSDAIPAATTTQAPRTAIAVMPFANLTGDATKDYLGDGMAEELINTLSKVPGLRVPARTSTFSYKGRNTDAQQIAKDLRVGTILEGSVRSAGTTLRITAQLIDAQTDSHLWSESYDRKFTELFKLQDDLAKAIVQALQVNLKSATSTSVLQAPPTQDLEAYQLYLQGSSLIDRTTEQNENRAIQYFQQAIARDPKFARAYAGIALAHNRLGTLLGRRPFEQYAAAERASRQALALDPNSAEAHTTLAAVNDSRGNRLEAEAHSLASLSLSNNDGYARFQRGAHQGRSGHLRDNVVESRKAMELAPANPLVIGNLASAYSLIGSDAEALKYADIAVELAYPRDSEPLASVYSDAALRAGHYAAAAEIATKALDMSDPEQARTVEVIKLVHAALANPAQRSSALAAQRRLYPPPAAATSSVTDLTNVGPCLESSYRYALLDALDGLDAAYTLASQCLDSMAPGAVYGGRSNTRLWSSWLRPFRQDPRFQAFATRLGFMEYWQQYGPPDDCDLKDGKLTCH